MGTLVGRIEGTIDGKSEGTKDGRSEGKRESSVGFSFGLKTPEGGAEGTSPDGVDGVKDG